MKKQLYFLLMSICFLIFINSSKAQLASALQPAGKKSVMMTMQRIGEIKKQVFDPMFRSSMTHIPEEEKENIEDARITQMKIDKTRHKNFSSSARTGFGNSSVLTNQYPEMGLNYGANFSEDNWPCDNTIAVSDGGIVVSLINSNIAYFDQNGINTYFSGLWDFYNDNSLVTNICDPKILYDHGADRFIFYTQTCNAVSADSYVIMSFSKTNDPIDGWWVYKFTGNPLNDNSWWDYPKMGVSHDDVFVTGNLYFEGSNSNNQSVIYQFDKSQGYAGANVNYFYYYNLQNNAFTLLPLQNYQAGNTDPDMYLVSTDGGTSTLHLWYIDNNVASGTATLNHQSLTTASSYTVGGYAGQSGGGNIDVGDNRAQSGFKLNGIAHLVFTSDIGSGWNGVNYNRIDLSNGNVSTFYFGDQGNFDVTYPAIIPFSVNNSDKSALIGFQYSGASVYPSYGVVYCDDPGSFSTGITVKSGEAAVVNCFNSNGNAQRCGDYSGIALKYNNTSPEAWVMGSYGVASGYWYGWNSEIHLAGTVVIKESVTSNKNLTLFPNPVAQNFKIKFEMAETEKVQIHILDMQGRQMKKLFEGYAANGENSFSFTKGNLTNGVYEISITDSKNKILKNEKFVVAD